MAEYNGMILTKAGMQLQAQAQIGGELHITKIAIGDGMLAAGESIEDLTALKSLKMTLGIQNMQVINGQSRIRALISNENLNTGFFVREVGVFARIGDTGTETLYSYTNAGDKADYLPNKGINVVEEVLEIYIVVGNAQNVTCLIDDRVTLATKQDIAEHNMDINAHSGAFLPISGGTMTGPIILAADPTTNMQAATKQYIDNNGGVNLRKNLHAYVVGDICYSKTAVSYKYMQCTVAGTTAAAEPATWPDVGQTVTDGTVTWVVRDIRAGEQIGSIKAWLANAAPPGWLALDTGALVNRATYPQLWAWVQANTPLITEAAWQAQAAGQSSVGYYSSGDGSTTFRLPRIVDFVRGADSTRIPGTWQADDFKSHTHQLTGATGSGGTLYGISGTGTTPTTWPNVTAPSGGSETRPKSVSMLYCVKAFDAPTNQGLIDITALANEVAGKQKSLAYIRIWDEKASGTAGGSFTSGAWRTRDLNQKQVYGADAVTVTGNQITLPAGAYEAMIHCPAYGVDSHKSRLQNITDGTTLILGANAISSHGDSTGTISVIYGTFTLSAQKTLEVQHYCAYTHSYGFGMAVNAGVPEIYTQVLIRKVG